VQIKHLRKHLTGLLEAALAAFFAIGVVYCIVFLDRISPQVRIQLTFVDIVDTAINASPGRIF